MFNFSQRLYLGFSLVIVLLALVGGTAYFSLNNASSGFDEYRSLARASNAVGEIQENMLMTRTKEKDFILTGNPQDKEAFDDYFKRTQQFIDEATSDVTTPQDLKTIRDLKASLDGYISGFDNVVTLKKQRTELVENTLNIKGPEIEKNWTGLLLSVKNEGDTQAAYNIALSIRSLLLARLYVVKFLEYNDQSSVDKVNSEFKDLITQLTSLNKELKNPSDKTQLNKIIQDIVFYKDTFNRVVAVISDRNTIISEKLNPVGTIVTKATQELNLSIKNTQDQLGPNLVESNTLAVYFIETIVAVAIILGITVAFFITRATTAQLGGDPALVTQVVRSVAEGDLEVELQNNNEKEASLYG